MMLPMTIDEDSARWTLSANLTASIRRVLRSRGVPERELDDKFQQVRLEVRASAHVPATEPHRTQYIHAIARNVARKYRMKLAAEGGEPLPLDEEAPAFAVEVAPYESIDLARRLHANAVATDAQGTDWFVRAKVYGERETSIADQAGVPVDRVRQRIRRLVLKMRANSDSLAMFASLLLFATFMAKWGLHKDPVKANPDEAMTAVTTSEPAPIAQEAAELRREALAACDAHQWTRCVDELDLAKGFDPSGDVAEDIQAARRAAAEGLRSLRGLPVTGPDSHENPRDIK